MTTTFEQATWAWDGGMQVLNAEPRLFDGSPATAVLHLREPAVEPAASCSGAAAVEIGCELRIEEHGLLLRLRSGDCRWSTELYGVGEIALGAAVQGELLRRYRLLVDLRGVDEILRRIGATSPGEPARWGMIAGVDPVTGTARKEVLSSSEVYRAIRDLTGHAVDFITSALARIHPEVASALRDGGLRLSGRAASWSGLAGALSYGLGWPVREVPGRSRLGRRRAG